MRIDFQPVAMLRPLAVSPLRGAGAMRVGRVCSMHLPQEPDPDPAEPLPEDPRPGPAPVDPGTPTLRFDRAGQAGMIDASIVCRH